MVHITQPAVPLSELFDLLRPGDIVTHLFHGKGNTVVENGRVLPALRRAQERGVGTDVGHGQRGFAFATARAALADGFKPYTISTDLHTESIEGPCFDLVTTMSKFLALGMTLDEVIAATTINAARTIRKDHLIGSLKPDLAGDVAVLEALEGDFTFTDTLGVTMSGDRMLKPVMTVLGGEIAASHLDGVATVAASC
jgi:dihydroorotase